MEDPVLVVARALLDWNKTRADWPGGAGAWANSAAPALVAALEHAGYLLCEIHDGAACVFLGSEQELFNPELHNPDERFDH